MRRSSLFWGFVLAVAIASGVRGAKLNVLFIATDDLRNDLGCYGDTLVKTPHLDRLAARSLVFNRAYSQQALCNPSRASLMCGRRPDALRIWDLPTHFRNAAPNVVTLPQLFREQGYFTQNIGKIFHNWRQSIQGDPTSWSVPAVMHFANHGDDKPVVDGLVPPNLAEDPKCDQRDVPDEAYYDGRVARLAVEALRGLKKKDNPFFLAVGFWKPHSPFNAPKRYWDLYRREDVALPRNPEWPKDAPRVAWHNSREILGEKGRTLTPDAVRELRHGYLANISYLDAQVGKVLDELARLGLAGNTIVVFWSDHGFHLGEQTLWAKTSNFELDARVPLLIAVPGMKTAGKKTDALAELLDLYPTLAELCGLSKPEGLDGVSLVPVLEDAGKSVKKAALTQHPRPAYYTGAPETMGYSLRSEAFRYVEWRDWKTGAVVARELYDHAADPDETRNLAGHPQRRADVERGAALLEELRPIVRPGWKPVLPAEVGVRPPDPLPGVVIDQSPDPQRVYVGCPGIAVLPNGNYVATHSWFGPGTSNDQMRAFGSSDRGRTWRHLSDVSGQWWSSLFVHRGALYLMGVGKQYGPIVIRRSTDGARTWTEPKSPATGILAADAKYHTAPVPLVVHNGRIWRAMEEYRGGWGTGFCPLVLSAPEDADLLDAKSWTLSNRLPWGQWKPYAGWLEGNIVVGPDGRLVNILRVALPRGEKAAIVRISDDGRTISFDPEHDFIDFPGGSNKFTIRWDEAARRYWSLVNKERDPTAFRNVLALVSSADLRNWTVETSLLRHTDSRRHAWQYIDWLVDGEDLIAASRTAWDGSHSAHDANYFTFHRFAGFRRLTVADSAPLLGPADTREPGSYEGPDFAVAGLGFRMAVLKDGGQAFSNRKYVWQEVPARLAGWGYTQTEGGVPPLVRVTAKRDVTLFVATADKGAALDDWKAEPKLEFRYTDGGRTRMLVFSRELKTGQQIELPQSNWSGTLVLAPP